MSHPSLEGRLERATRSPLSVNGAAPPRAGSLHDARIATLAKRVALHIESLAPQGRVYCLDVGCGDTALAEAVQQRVERAHFSCIDAVRLGTVDGGALPYEDGEFDVALICDALHTSPEEAAPILAEAARVAGHVLVEVPKRHFTRASFAEIAAQERLVITALDCGLDLYERAAVDALPKPDWQFIAVLARRSYKNLASRSKV